MFFVYILYSPSANKYYIGHTNDPERRLWEHNKNLRNTFTKKFGPWQLKTFFRVNDKRGDAMKIEKYIKKQKNRLLIEELINNPHLFEELAQLVRVPIHRD